MKQYAKKPIAHKTSAIPLPLEGGVRGGGATQEPASVFVSRPPTQPPPQGGRSQTGLAGTNFLFIGVCLAFFFFCNSAAAQTVSQPVILPDGAPPATSVTEAPMPAINTTGVAPLDVAARQAFILDSNTDTPLYAKDADTQMPTSSMSKMMTIYLVFEAIKNGKLKLDGTLPASEHAWKQEGSRMYLNIGENAKVEDLIRGVVIQSGNDAAVVLAEGLGGSEENFAEMMNAKAQDLGMNHSHFVNATGLPDPQHYSTARDLAILAQALIRDFPEDYHYFSEQEFTYNGIKQGNRNPLLYRNMQVDGLKTGHTDVGGFGLTASALRNGHRLIIVLNGMQDMQARADESAKALDWGYREFGLYPIAKAGQSMAEAKVFLGKSPGVALLASKDVVLTLPHAARAGLKADVTFTQPVKAPVTKGQQLGVLTITAPGMEAQKIPLVAANDVARLGFFARMVAKLHLMFHKS